MKAKVARSNKRIDTLRESTHKYDLSQLVLNPRDYERVDYYVENYLHDFQDQEAFINQLLSENVRIS